MTTTTEGAHPIVTATEPYIGCRVTIQNETTGGGLKEGDLVSVDVSDGVVSIIFTDTEGNSDVVEYPEENVYHHEPVFDLYWIRVHSGGHKILISIGPPKESA